MESAFPGPLWVERMPVRFIHRGAWSDTIEARTVSGSGGASAVKVAEAGGDLAEQAERWVEVTSKISEAVSHPNIMAYQEVAIVDGWLSAERSYVEGVDVATAIASAGPAPFDVAAAIAHAVATGAAAMHAAGLVAGHITPSHILVGRDGRVQILHAGAPAITAGIRERADRVEREVAFAPPERFLGDPIEKSADVFGIASLLHLLAVGQPAIPETHRLARILSRRGAVLVSSGDLVGGIDEPLNETVSSALTGDASSRPPLDALLAVLSSRAAAQEEVAGWARALVGEAALGDGRE